MNEYIEWLFLRELIGWWVNNNPGKGDLLYFKGKPYSIERMKKKYIELTELLLKDYLL